MAVDPTGLRIVPADAAPVADVLALLGPGRCHGSACMCQRFRIPTKHWVGVLDAEKEIRLAAQAQAGEGVLAYLDDQPVGWAGVAPRVALGALMTRALLWSGRPDEDRTDPDVWSVHCFFVRAGFRGRGLARPLLVGAVDQARRLGAKVIEGYPMIAPKGQVVTWGEMHVGSPATFSAAQFVQVSQPSKRRVVMRRAL